VITRTIPLLLAVSAGACLAQEGGGDTFDRMIEHYQGLAGCTLRMGVEMRSDDPRMTDSLKSMGQATRGYAVKPNRFAFWDEQETSPDMGMATPEFHGDGEQVISALTAKGMYSIDPAPETFAGFVERAKGERAESWQMLPGSIFVFALMSPEPRDALGEFVKDVEYKGVQGDGAYHVLSATQVDSQGGTLPLELHVSASGAPWLLAVKPDLRGQGAPSSFELVLTFEDWQETDAAPPEGVITPRTEWKKVEHLAEAVMAAPAPDEAPAGQAAAPGEGERAPAFVLDTVGGGTFRLADHKGKVVVLDFWATWCPPCVRGMPTMIKVTGEYAEKGVVFAGVNFAEQPGKVAEFMEERGWEFTSPLDADGQVAESYGVGGIPHSVIIDKKGMIRHVHVGFGGPEETEARLRAELDALIAEQ
jgi:peroxiredoxin